jgi:hypothetical protein
MGLFALLMIPGGEASSAKSPHFVLHFFFGPSEKASFSFVPNKKRRFAALFADGGENGIRTHEPLLAITHFPGVRLRPTRPSLLSYCQSS